MNRQEIQRQIAELDQEINAVLGSAELPKYDLRPFPTGTWIFALLCLAWAEFGSMIPGAYSYHLQTAVWASRVGMVMVVVAVLSTVSWFLRGRGYQKKSSSYTEASHKARDLQERRRELQADLRSLTEE